MPKRVPKIRFKKYTDEWKEDILSEFLEVSKEKNFLEEYYKTDVLSVSGECGIVNQIEHKGRSFAGASVANYGVVDTGDVVYTKSPLLNTPYGIIKTNKSKPGIVSTLYAVYKPKESIDPNFIECYFEQNARINNYLKPLVNKGAKNDMKVTDENALNGLVIFPNKDEQKEISKFLVNYEKNIQIMQKKIDKITSVKNILLSKVFGQCEKIGFKIKFKLFNDIWNYKTIDSLTNEIKAGGTPSTANPLYWYPKEIPWISSGEIHKKFISKTNTKISKLGLQNSSARWVDQNSILIALAGQGKTRGTVAINKIPLTTNQSIAAITFDDNIIPEFILYNLESRYNELRMMSSGNSSRGGLNKKLISEISIPYIFKKEQEKIGLLFMQLDKLIILYQSKLDKLKEIKQAFINHMFVNKREI